LHVIPLIKSVVPVALGDLCMNNAAPAGFVPAPVVACGGLAL
jgi:hypothetical protein